MLAQRSTFSNRADAGRQLAEALLASDLRDPVVVALPRGGVPVGFEIAQRLAAPLHVLIVRKIGAPGHPEIGIGAVVHGREPHVVVSEEAARQFQLPPGYIAAERDRQLAEIDRRRRMYLGEDADKTPDHAGRPIVLVDDGVANGVSIRAAIARLREIGVSSIHVAVPVAPAAVVELLSQEVEQVTCLAAPERLGGVSVFYDDFDQVDDQEVIRLLKLAREDMARRARSDVHRGE